MVGEVWAALDVAVAGGVLSMCWVEGGVRVSGSGWVGGCVRQCMGKQMREEELRKSDVIHFV